MASSTQPSVRPASAQPRPGERRHRPIGGYTWAGWPSVTFTVPGRHVNHVPSPEITRPLGLGKPICPVGLGCVPASGPGRLRRGARGGLEWPTRRPHARGPVRLLPAVWVGSQPLSRPPSGPGLPCAPALPALPRLQVPSWCRQGPAPPCVPSTPHLTTACCLQPPLRSATSCCCPQGTLACSPCGPLTHLGSLSGQSAPGQALSSVSVQ